MTSPFPGADVLHLDLAGDPSTWTIPNDGRHAFVTFWYRDVPLGSTWLDREELPLHPSATADRAAAAIAPAVGFWSMGAGFEPLLPDAPYGLNATRQGQPDVGRLVSVTSPVVEAYENARRQPGSGVRPTLRVVICTRERADALTRCLTTLCGSDEPAEEIVVVDNAPSTSATRDVVAAFPGVAYIVEPRPGLSHARNAGMDGAQTDLVAYSDDDVVVDPLWTARVRDALASGDFAAMTGLVLPASLDTVAQCHFERGVGGFGQGYRPIVFDEVFFGSSLHYGVPVWRIGAGANMAFTRRALQQAGPFDPRLGAGASGCSEDSEMWYRLLAAGERCLYDPRAVVHHYHRADTDALRSQLRAYLRGHVVALLVQYERWRHWGNLHRVLFSLPKYFLSRVVRRIADGDVEGRIHTLHEEVRGAIEGVLWYLVRGRSSRVQRESATYARGA